MLREVTFKPYLSLTYALISGWVAVVLRFWVGPKHSHQSKYVIGLFADLKELPFQHARYAGTYQQVEFF